MNYLWGGMILIGIIYGTVTGHLEEVSEAAIQSSKEAVSLCVVCSFEVVPVVPPVVPVVPPVVVVVPPGTVTVCSVVLVMVCPGVVTVTVSYGR